MEDRTFFRKKITTVTKPGRNQGNSFLPEGLWPLTEIEIGALNNSIDSLEFYRSAQFYRILSLY